MDIRSLQYFIAVVEAGTISGAAKKLNISQPPLSQQIKLLESELGVVLMKRGPRNIVLTDAGKTLYKRALSIVDFINVTHLEISNYNNGLQGVLRIGTASSCGPILLDIIEDAFRKTYPNITYQIFEKNTFELMELLENNIIEIAFARTPFPEGTSINSLILTKESIIATGTELFLTNEEDLISFQQLVDKPLIVYRRWEPIISGYFKKHNINPQYYCINDDARTSISWARSGMGIALVPSSVSNYFRDERLICKMINDEFLQTEICLVWKSSRYLSPIATNFIEVIKHYKKTNPQKG